MKARTKQLLDYHIIADTTALTAYNGPLSTVVLLTGRSFTWNSSSTRTADGVNVVLATGKGSGRWIGKYKIFIDVLDHGAVGDGIADDTAAIQAAINYAVALQNPAVDIGFPVHRGADCQVYVPYGRYKITSALSVPGTVRLSGSGGGAYAGSMLVQATDGISMLVLDAANDGQSNATVVENLIFKSGSASSNGNVAQIIVGTGNGNSNYIRNCWFQAPENYAIWITKGGDVQISGCTFDIVPFHCICIGKSTEGSVVDVSITDNTFFEVALNCVRLIKAKGLIFANNRISNSAGATHDTIIINGQDATFISSLTITGNEYTNVRNFAYIPYNTFGLTITGNTGYASDGFFFSLNGTGILFGATIVGNSVYSNSTSAANRLIDGGAGALQGCTIVGNAFYASTAQTNAIYLTHASTLNNQILGNAFTNFTTPYNVSSPVSNGIFSAGLAVQGVSALSRSGYITSITTDMPSGFYVMNGSTGMPTDPSGFNNWMVEVIRHENGSGTADRWSTLRLCNIKTKAQYVGGWDVQTGALVAWSRVHDNNWLKVSESMTPTNGQALVWNNTTQQWENTTLPTSTPAVYDDVAQNGLLASTAPLATVTGVTTTTSATAYQQRITANASGSVSKIYIAPSTPGATLTANSGSTVNNGVVITTLAGVVLAWADCTTAFTSATVQSVTLNTPVTLVAGTTYLVFVIATGTTTPQFRATAANSVINAGISAYPFRSSSKASTPLINTGTQSGTGFGVSNVRIWVALGN